MAFKSLAHVIMRELIKNSINTSRRVTPERYCDDFAIVEKFDEEDESENPDEITPLWNANDFVGSMVYCTSGQADNSTDQVDSRFVEIPVDVYRTQLVDLSEQPNLELLSQVQRIASVRNYLLFTRQNPDSAQYIENGDSDSVQSSNFNPSDPTVVLIHGWGGRPDSDTINMIKQALLNSGSLNVIAVDWRRVAALGYATAVFGVPSVGRDVGSLLAFLHATTNALYSNMHVVGHSLGAHVAASAGSFLQGQLARITGLDPAGPLWSLLGISNPNGLASTDAVYVEAIHTDGSSLGIGQAVGDADFFPNGGSSQPGCATNVCNHFRSCALFAASITNDNFVGRKCTSMGQMRRNNCRGSEFLMGNNDLQKFGTGIYRLKTSRNYPYNQ